MSILVKIPGNQTLQVGEEETIRPLFENTGIPGYFTIASEIPPTAFDLKMPLYDYRLEFRGERAPRFALRHHEVFLPSIQEVLWAIGWASIGLINVVCERPVRFLHQPFRAHMCSWKNADAWRQIIVSRKGKGYAVETASVKDDTKGFFLGYLHSTWVS